MEYQIDTLKNGIRVVHLQANSPVANCGMLVNVGSRDELDHEHGVAHFIEHMIFKGTTKRKAYHILSRLDDVGGEINAYTTKEETAFYAAFLKRDFARAIELIADIVFHSTFPKPEIEREREVVIDEINSYKDNPSELIFDDFEEEIFKGHPIARNILGTPETLKSFDKQTITNFLERTYHTDQMIFCSVGDIPFHRVKKLAEKYFGEIPENHGEERREPFQTYQPLFKIKELNTYQAHCMIGNIAFNALDKRRMDLILLNNILGGQGLNSRLNMSLREKHGYAYSVESSFTPYFDTGVLSIYFGTEKEKLDKSIKLVNKELSTLRNTKIGSMQLHRAKNQITGQIAISSDNKENLLFTLGKSFLLFNKFEPLSEVNKRIEGITAERLMEVANEVLDQDKLSTLIYQ